MTQLDDVAKAIRAAYGQADGLPSEPPTEYYCPTCDLWYDPPEHHLNPNGWQGAGVYQVNRRTWEELGSQEKHLWLHMAAAALEVAR